MAASDELTREVQGTTSPAPGSYKLDTAHSVIGFVVRHLMVSKVRGEFKEFDGSIVVGDSPETSKVEVTIDANSISTRQDQRDNHLRSGDFFEVETYPTWKFVSTEITPKGGDNWEITGDLTIKGVTKSVTLDTEFNGAIVDARGNARFGFSATTTIDRTEFGVTFNSALEGGGLMLGNDIKVEIEGEALRQD